MPLNEATGNMYGFVTRTFNMVKGECPHGCRYCYMKRWGRQAPARLDLKERATDLGNGKFIFIGSSCDLFASDIPGEWIGMVLEKAAAHDNQYLVQSKNPARFHRYLDKLPPERFTLCTAIETNRAYPEFMGRSPPVESRIAAMCRLPRQYRKRKMITVEPVMDFNLKELSYGILCCDPCQVNIGADSGHNALPEPPAEKIRGLIASLKTFTRAVEKNNLRRIVS
jgi:DNA repair photolyase